MALQPELAERLRALDAERRAAEARARRVAGRAFSDAMAQPRRAFLAAIREADERGASQQEIADTLGLSRGRAYQLVNEARQETT